MDSGKKLLMTMTGEMHQPVRLYYEVYDKTKLLQTLKTLRCVQFDHGEDRWVWLFQSETKKFKFATPYGKIPKHRRPIVIGAMRFPRDDSMWIDLRSWERATKAIVFFDRRLQRSVAQVTHAAIVNRLFDVGLGSLPPLDAFFDESTVTEKNPEDILQAIEPLQAIGNVRHRAEMAFDLMERESHMPLPDVEKFPVHFYEDGITSLETAFKLRQMVAFEHWQGNTGYTMGDLIKQIFPGL